MKAKYVVYEVRETAGSRGQIITALPVSTHDETLKGSGGLTLLLDPSEHDFFRAGQHFFLEVLKA